MFCHATDGALTTGPAGPSTANFVACLFWLFSMTAMKKNMGH